MRFLSDLRTADPVDCPYLPNRSFIQEYFFADSLSHREFSRLLAAGWRRFGNFFFRPNCPGCVRCIPIRVDVRSLSPTRSQRRIITRGRDVRMEAVEPRPSDEAWLVYSEHSLSQFGKGTDREDFERTFFDKAVPAFQTEYRLDGNLIALGFLDAGDEGMSSAYFSFRAGMVETLARFTQRVPGVGLCSGERRTMVLFGLLGSRMSVHGIQSPLWPPSAAGLRNGRVDSSGGLFHRIA